MQKDTDTPESRPSSLPTFLAPEQSMFVPSSRRQSWGAVISIVVILLMVVLGAYYSWEKSVYERQHYAPGISE